VPPLKTPTEEVGDDAAADERAQRDAWAAKVIEIRSKLKQGSN